MKQIYCTGYHRLILLKRLLNDKQSILSIQSSIACIIYPIEAPSYANVFTFQDQSYNYNKAIALFVTLKHFNITLKCDFFFLPIYIHIHLL